MYKDVYKKIILLTMLLTVTACVGFGGNSPPTYHYVLSSDIVSNTNTTIDLQSEQLSIGLWLVTLPDMLDRPQIVTRIDQYGIQLGEFDRWAGDLKLNMTQQIADELRVRLRTDRVTVYPWLTNQAINHQVKINVVRFDGTLGGAAVLKGTWVLLDGNGKKELFRESFFKKSDTKDISYTAMVATLSKLVTALSEQISAGIDKKNKLLE